MGFNVGKIFQGGRNVEMFRKNLWQKAYHGLDGGKMIQAWRFDNRAPHAIQSLKIYPNGTRTLTTCFGEGGVAREVLNSNTGKCDLAFISRDNKVYRAVGNRDDAQVKSLAEMLFGHHYGAKSQILNRW